jgi:hypothetical protein
MLATNSEQLVVTNYSRCNKQERRACYGYVAPKAIEQASTPLVYRARLRNNVAHALNGTSRGVASHKSSYQQLGLGDLILC